MFLSSVSQGKRAGSGSMFGIIMALLIFLAQASAQFNSSCVQVMDSAAAGASPYYPDDEPSLTFTMEGATNLKTNTVSSRSSAPLGG